MRFLSQLGGIAIIIGVFAVVGFAIYLVLNRKKIQRIPVILWSTAIAVSAAVVLIQFCTFSIDMPQTARISNITLPESPEFRYELTGEAAQEVTDILKPLKYRREVLYTETLTEDEYIHFMLFDTQNENMNRLIGFYFLFIDEPEKSIFQDGNVQYTVIASEETIQELMSVFDAAEKEEKWEITILARLRR